MFLKVVKFTTYKTLSNLKKKKSLVFKLENQLHRIKCLFCQRLSKYSPIRMALLFANPSLFRNMNSNNAALLQVVMHAKL